MTTPCTPTTISTPEGASRTRIEVVRPERGGRAAVRIEVSGPADRPLLRPMLLSSDGRGARMALVPDGALLLAGDRIVIEIVLGPGARLDLVEPAGTVAYAMDGGHASWDVSIDLGPMATLVWAGEPLIVAETAAVRRRTQVACGWGASMALRETVVLGRHGERPGSLWQRCDVVGTGRSPVLSESLEVGPRSSRLLLGGARAIGSVLLLGHRLAPSASVEGARFDLQAEGTLVRTLAADAHRAAAPLAWAAARDQVTSYERSAPGSRTPVRSPQPSRRLG